MENSDSKEEKYFIDKLDCPEEVLQYLKDYYPDFFDIVMKEHFVPNNLDEVNNFLLYSYFGVKKDGRIECDYFGTQKDEKENKTSKMVITKNNFYNAYCEKIWPNLTIEQQIQVLYWHFIYKCEEINITDYTFRIVENDDYITGNDCLGYARENKKCVFLQVDSEIGYSYNYFNYIATIEHEFEHVLQYKVNKTMLRKKGKFNLYELCILEDPNLILFDNGELNDAVYRSNPAEYSAENKAMKQMAKYLRANEQFFGVLKSDRTLFEEVLSESRFRWLKLQKRELDREEDFTDEQKENYLKKLKIYQDKDYFLKLCLLRDYLLLGMAFIESTELLDEMNKKYEKIEQLLELYVEKQEKEKLDAHFFDELNLEEDQFSK